MTWTEIIMLILGSDVLTGVIAFMTLRSKIAMTRAEADRAKADAEKAKAEAESLRITNTDQATRVLMENIVKPLKEELHETREELRDVKGQLESTKKEMGSTKRAMGRLRKAIDDANGCVHRDGCPVLERLRHTPKDERDDGEDPGVEGVAGGPGHRSKRGADHESGDHPEAGGGTAADSGQPP